MVILNQIETFFPKFKEEKKNKERKNQNSLDK